MRHRVDHRKLGRTAAHRRAMLCNMVTSLFASERITTTDAKAKEARRLAERLITRARKGYTAHQEGLSLKELGKTDEAKQMESIALAHWRQAGRHIRKTSVLKKLFDEIAPAPGEPARRLAGVLEKRLPYHLRRRGRARARQLTERPGANRGRVEISCRRRARRR